MIKKGDTLIEVTLAVGIFSMIAIAIVFRIILKDCAKSRTKVVAKAIAKPKEPILLISALKARSIKDIHRTDCNKNKLAN